MKIFLVFIGLAVLFSGCTAKLSYEDDSIEIPLSELSPSMQKYTYDADGVAVRYFAMLDSDNQVRVAFDACDVCGGHLGYKQEGDYVVCNNCGLKFPVSELGTNNKGGGCWPSHLGYMVENGVLKISEVELTKGSSFFT